MTPTFKEFVYKGRRRNESLMHSQTLVNRLRTTKKVPPAMGRGDANDNIVAESIMEGELESNHNASIIKMPFMNQDTSMNLDDSHQILMDTSMINTPL